MYDAAGAWGGTNPFPGTLLVLTHRVDDQPDDQPDESAGRAHQVRRPALTLPGVGSPP